MRLTACGVGRTTLVRRRHRCGPVLAALSVGYACTGSSPFASVEYSKLQDLAQRPIATLAEQCTMGVYNGMFAALYPIFFRVLMVFFPPSSPLRVC